MPSYNEVEGVPAHENRELLQDVGRKRLGFRGAYFSDYGGIENLIKDHHVARDADEAAILALDAGVDADLPDGVCYSRLAPLVRSGRASQAKLDEAVARILALKFEAGLFENPFIDPRRALREVNTPSDIALAREAAQKALILFKNDGILPLDPKAKQRIALIGPNSVEPLLGGYSGENAKSVGLLAGLRAAAGANIGIEQSDGVWITVPDAQGRHAPMGDLALPTPAENAARIAEAVKIAERADLIVLAVGDNPQITREAVRGPGDRSTLGLFGQQDALIEAMIATGKPIVAILLNGRPLAVGRLAEKANALVEGWYLGQEGGHALADCSSAGSIRAAS
jgi:beta-glucosidase